MLQIKKKSGIAVLAAALMLSLAGCASETSADSTVTAESPAEVSSETSSKPETSLKEDSSSEADDTSSEESAPEQPAAPAENETAAFDLTQLEYDESDNTWSTADEEYKKFVSLMKRECAKSGVKGTYLLATDDKVLFFGGIDSTETDGKTKVGDYTTYEIGSITKTFTATAVLQLCEQGRLSLDDKLTKFFPEFEKGVEITIFDLLHMKSGLQREFFPDEKLYTDYDLFKRYYLDGCTDEEMLEALFASELKFEPGTNTLYSNAGYGLLAMIVEQVSGEGYADYVQKNIFDVCGMEHTSSMKTGDVTSVPEPPPEGHYQFDVYDVTDKGYAAWAHSSRGVGDIHSCAADMLAFDRALIGGGLLNEDSLSKMLEMNVPAMAYGCGWEAVKGSPSACFHEGATPLFLASNAVCRDTKYGNVYLIQLQSNIANLEHIRDCLKNVVMAVKT